MRQARPKKLNGAASIANVFHPCTLHIPPVKEDCSHVARNFVDEFFGPAEPTCGPARANIHGHPSAAHAIRESAVSLRQAIFRTQQWLLSQQHPDGYWVAELEGDTILESEFLLLLAFLKEEHTPLAKKCAAYLLEKQARDGFWTQYPGGGLDLSATVKAYFALKLAGHDPSSAPLQKARAVIMAAGGADRVNSFTRFYLALLGQIPYEACPNVPPEFVLLPKWFPVNLYSISAWSRTMTVPLSIMSAYQPVRQIEPERGIRELFLSDPLTWPYPRCPGLPQSKRLVSWDRFFHGVDALFKFAQRHKLLPLRRLAIDKAKHWMLARFRASDGLGAIFPPMIWSIVALRSLGLFR